MSAIYGPFIVMTHDAAGELTEVPAAGVHYTTDEAFFAATPDLAPYRVTPANPLQNVLAGDDRAAPVWTVALRFPDQATADGFAPAVLA